MYEGGMHQFEPWEEPRPDVTEAEADERWNKETIRQLAEALRRVITTGVNGGVAVQTVLLISRHWKSLDADDLRLADASEAAMEAARMALWRVEQDIASATKAKQIDNCDETKMGG